MKNIENIKNEFPLHWLIWNNDHKELENALKSEKFDKEKLDPRGRTPLLLAVKLSYLQCVKCLLAAKCNANFECEGWSIVQEAVCAGDEAILTAVLEVRDLQRHIQRVTHVPKLLQLLLDAPDFYVEMKWEFTTWVPLMSRLCPSDTYKVYKRGSNVRIDTTLLGFDNATWQRGNRTYIFKGQKETATMIEIDHDTQEVIIENLAVGNINEEIVAIPPPIGSVKARLNAPVMTNCIDMDKISFERNKSGIWGWRSEKLETVNGYNCKVYGASNVEFVTKSRTEHLNEDQLKTRNCRTPLQSFLGIAEDEYNSSPDLASYREKQPSPHSEVRQENGAIESSSSSSSSSSSGNNTPKNSISAEEYFSDENLNGRDIGRPKKINTKIQRFKANLWLSDEFPIKLQEQVLPILDLMSALAGPHVSKLKDFITMQLPSGFPVKVEIPLFHVLNACVTFGNVFATESQTEYVTTIQEEERLTCIIDDQCFEIPSHYSNRSHDMRRQVALEDEDDLLQYAIEQSLLESGSESDKVDVWEALRGHKGNSPNSGAFSDEDAQLQRVLQESMLCQVKGPGGTPTSDSEDTDYVLMDPDLAMAIRLSEQEHKKRELELKQEEEMMEQALRLSLQEK